MVDISVLFNLVSTPFGIAVACLTLATWIHTKFEVEKKLVRVFIPWGIGIILSVIMWFTGKNFDFGAYALYEFNTLKEWAIFVFVALSPGFISNGMFDTGFLQAFLKMLGVSSK